MKFLYLSYMSMKNIILHPSQYQEERTSDWINRFFGVLFGITFLISIPLIFWTLSIYWTTLIDGYCLFLLALFIGFSITILFRKRIDLSSSKHDLPRGVQLILFCVFNSFSFGTIIIFFILWGNQAFGGRSHTTMKIAVTSFGHTRPTRNNDPVPFVEAMYKNKKVGKYYPRYADVEHVDSLKVSVINGWLGFEVVVVE